MLYQLFLESTFFSDGKMGMVGCPNIYDDGEVDFDLIEPTGVDWCMDQNDTRIDLTQPLLRGSPAMRRAVVYNPKQPFPRPIGFLCQHLLDQPAKGCNTGPRFTPAHDIAPAYVPGGQILQGPLALIFVLNIGRAARRRRQGGMATVAGLDAGLLVGAQDVVLGPQGFALPQARIEVQNRASLVNEAGITRKNPVLVSPRFEGIRIEHPPHHAATD